MKSRLTTILLTALITALLVNALSPWLRPPSVAAESARFSSIQFSRSQGGWWFFDTRNGDVWIYDEGRKVPLWHYRINELGAPPERISLVGKPPSESSGAAGQKPTPPAPSKK